MNGAPKGCGSKGHCTSGRCNKMNTFDWLSNLDLQDPTSLDMVEVSFKNGARKDFYRSKNQAFADTGDMVVVEASNGYDVGRITLSGELVRLQMKKKRIHEDSVIHRVLRCANERDLEKLDLGRLREKDTMIRARSIAQMLDLDMKISDVEIQGDNRKATFYYTADGRIDFRELVRHLANEFKIRIEMRQIGARQESARIGGLGPCGRELCCSTWLSDFKSVNISAARYQNLAINQTKLSGQCGRLKCCLNYELDSYMHALKDFPENANRLRSSHHKYELLKTDIFKGLMFYNQILDKRRGSVIVLRKERVREILAMNKKGDYPEKLSDGVNAIIDHQGNDIVFEDGTGQIVLPSGKTRGKSRHKKHFTRRKQNQRMSSSKNRRREETKGSDKTRDRHQGQHSKSQTRSKKQNEQDRLK